MRLVRTETNHFQNRAELQSYKDEDVEYYRFDATLDGRTSDICRELNGKIFRVADAIEGVNYPAMHVNCRSTTTIVFPNEAKEEKVYTSEDAREIFEEVSSVMDIKSSEGYWKERNAKESV
jgi:NAD+--asparagine ADP-ribosyltransferase